MGKLEREGVTNHYKVPHLALIQLKIHPTCSKFTPPYLKFFNLSFLLSFLPTYLKFFNLIHCRIMFGKYNDIVGLKTTN